MVKTKKVARRGFFWYDKNMEDNFVRINIAFMPPKEVVDLAMRLSSKISQKADAFFVLDGKNFYPHITIYSPEFPAKNLDWILSDVEDLSKKISSVKFKFSKMAPERGWIGIEAELSEEIKNIHSEIIKSLNPLREDHLREKDLANLENLTEEKRNILQKYGHPSVMELYRPHLTLIRLKDEKTAEKIASEIEWPTKEFTIDKIGAYKMGDHGTCTDLIKEFNLK